MKILQKYFRFFRVLSCFAIALLFICGCDRPVQMLDEYPAIFPDYKGVTIPVNIAPLNFGIADGCERIKVRFMHHDSIMMQCKGRRNINIPARAWKKLLRNASDSKMQVQVYVRRSGKWYGYRPFDIHATSDLIDPYIVYRLIEPGYELWDQMGIYQRNLSNFSESAIIHNRLTERSCINCHSFHDYNPERLMFHSRGQKSDGTFLFADGRQQRVNTQTGKAPTAGTYPAWHPSGNYIAFSINVTRQAFHALPGKRIEVYDLESDLSVWDVKNNVMLRDTRFTCKEKWETFPTWSPDGKWLYYCAADPKNMPFEIERIKYGLFRVAFDAATGRFGEQIDTLLLPETTGISVLFPRISPDGRYLLYTASTHGVFPIWHNGANLEMIDLNDFSDVDIQAINSDEADSYHAWSSNGRWIVFSSRRIDGLYTHLYFAYFDASGKIHKPFLLPQKTPDHYARSLRSYNIPEFVKGKVKTNPYEISRTMKESVTDLKEIIHP